MSWISPLEKTAWVTAHARSMSDIPRARQFYDELSRLAANSGNRQELASLQSENIGPDIEARNQLIAMGLEPLSRFSTVIELGSGFSPRGTIARDDGSAYFEVDLPLTQETKSLLLKNLNCGEILGGHLIAGNVLSAQTWVEIDKISAEGPLAFVNEGLMRYLSFAQKKYVAQKIVERLQLQSGIWVTADVTLAQFVESQREFFRSKSDEASEVFLNNIKENCFRDLDHALEFFRSFELHVEVKVGSEVQHNLSDKNLRTSSWSRDVLSKVYVLTMKPKYGAS